ncbi:hypothetical protein ACFL20_11645 [Spirochaetota bacterium]
MKKIRNKTALIILSLIIFTISCGSISVRKDPINNSTVVTLKEFYYFNNKMNGFTYITYINEIKDNKNKFKMKIEYKTDRHNESKNISKKSFFNINGKKYDLIVNSAANKSDLSIEGERTGKFERNTYNEDIDLKAKMEKTFYGTINLSEGIFDAIKVAKSVSFRFFLNDKPLTITMSESSINKLKEFVNTKPK